MYVRNCVHHWHDACQYPIMQITYYYVIIRKLLITGLQESHKNITIYMYSIFSTSSIVMWQIFGVDIFCDIHTQHKNTTENMKQ